MQKNLLTHPLALFLPIRGTFSRNKSWLVAGITLLLVALNSTLALATDFTSNFVTINSNIKGAATTTRYSAKRPSNSSVPSIQSKYFGSFDRTYNSSTNTTTTDSLFVSAEANTLADNGESVANTQLFYKVYRQDGTGEPTSDIPLDLPIKQGDDPSGQAQWIRLTNRTNLINLAPTPGTYVLAVYFQSTVTKPDEQDQLIFDYGSTNGKYYTATFQVTIGNSNVQASQWKSGNNDRNWFNANNWSPAGIPNSNTDVTIPYISGGVYPLIDGQPALVHNLTISGKSNNSLGARLTLAGSQLSIYGDFLDLNSGFLQTGKTSALILAGQNQVFDASPTLLDFRITGGGTKTLPQRVTIVNSLTFTPVSNRIGAGILATRTDNPGSYSVTLLDGAKLVTEGERGYVLGVVTTNRPVLQGIKNDFGGIGIELTSNSTSPGKVTVTRSSTVYNGAGTSVSIRRGFSFQSENDVDHDYDLIFHYLNTDLGGVTSDKLRLFRSESGDIPFILIDNATVSASAKTLTRTGITGTLNSLFTIGNSDNPLPVTLVSFTATPTPQGAALLHWVTASEKNNKGFGIERQLGSNDAWQQVGYAAAAVTPNGNTYNFTDKSLITAPFSAQAYYRLRQEDLDGKVSYSPVAVISRQAGVTSTELQLSPVPVDGPSLSVAFAEAGLAGLEVAIINTQGQRMLHLTTAASDNSALSVPVTSLAPGVYILSVQAPGQAARRARFVKL